MASNDFLNLLYGAADQYGVPRQLAHNLIQTESNWNPNARGTSGEIGLGQLMPATARSLGVTDPSDPQQNIDGSMRYLAQQLKTFGDPALAAAAYNAGPGRVRQFQSGKRDLPSSTKDYVRKVVGVNVGEAQTFPYVEPGQQQQAQPVEQQMPTQTMNPELQAVMDRILAQITNPAPQKQSLLGNPYFQAGIGILGANQGTANGRAGPAIAQGIASGMQNASAYQAAQEQQQRQKLNDSIAALNVFRSLAPQAPQLTAAQKDYQYGLMHPEFAAQQEAARNRSPVQISIDQGNKAAAAMAGEIGKSEAKALSDSRVAAETAHKQNQSLDTYKDLSKNSFAGGLAPVQKQLGNFLSSFGYSGVDLTNTNVMQGIIGDILASKMSQLGARGLTDKDMEILRDSLPRMETDPQARVAIIDILQKSNDSTIQDYIDRQDLVDKNPQLKGVSIYRPKWTKNWSPRYSGQGNTGQGDIGPDPLGLRE